MEWSVLTLTHRDKPLMGMIMKKFLALVLMLGAASTTLARQPMLAPESLAVKPTLASPVPPAPGVSTEDMQGVQKVTGTLVVNPPQPVPELSRIEPGVIVCDAIAAPTYYTTYTKVNYLLERNIAPCAVKKLVAVPDPCNPCKCVLVAICVPPCACEEVIVHPRKDRVTFNYGKYQVRITARNGHLNVVYLD